MEGRVFYFQTTVCNSRLNQSFAFCLWSLRVQYANYNDSVNGMAGIWGQTIDGVQMYYITPNGDYKQVYYRSQDVAHANWHDEVCDNGTTYGGDDYAGMYGYALDRLQCYVSDGTRR